MSLPLDELYFIWLYERVGSVRTTAKRKTYWNLLRQLYTTEFVWLIPNDDNRAVDGMQLRFEFCQDHGLDPDRDWMNLPCSVLEMMIALTRRLSFEAEGEPRWWFWHLLQNLGLEGLNDATAFRSQDVDDVLHDLIWRQYKPDGRGGLFPLDEPTEDQRRVEIWYQLGAYLLERAS